MSNVKENKIKVSIIIPHYNSGDIVNRLLETIPISDEIQTILVDDRSTEKIPELEATLEKWSNKNIEFYVNDSVNKSAGAARNIGLKYAIGEWVLFADADDYFADNFYEKLSMAFELACDIIFFSPRSIELETGKTSDRHFYLEELLNAYCSRRSRINENRLKYLSVTPYSKLIRRSLIMDNNVLFDETRVANDVMFAMRCGYFSKTIDALQECIYIITKKEGTLTTLKDVKTYDIRLEVFVNMNIYLREKMEKHEFSQLNISGLGIIIKAVANRYGLRKYIQIMRILRKNKIPIILLADFNPLRLFRVAMRRRGKQN